MRRKFSAAFLGLFVIVTLQGCAACAQANKSHFPEMNLTIPYEEFTLDNGLKVIVHEDRNVPVVSIQVVYRVGSKDEPAGSHGYAHLFEHLMFNGSENSDVDFFVPMREMGAFNINGSTSADRTNYYETVPKGALERALFLESDRMGHLLGGVSQQKLDEQIGVVKNEKKNGDDQPYGRVWYQILENLYPKGHPYHHSTIGSMEDVGNATLEDIERWFATYYGAANTFVVLAGDIDVGEAKHLVQKYFGHIPSGPPLVQKAVNNQPLSINKYSRMYDHVGLPRVYRAYIAQRRADADAEDFTLATKILGEGKTSRLHKRLVEEDQLATRVDVVHIGNLLSGMALVVVTATSEDHVDIINKILNEELSAFVSDGPTEDELRIAKSSYLTPYVRSMEHIEMRNQALSEGELYFGRAGHFVDTYLPNIRAATPTSVKQSAGKTFASSFHEIIVYPFPNYSTAESSYDRTLGLPSVEQSSTSAFPETTRWELSNGIDVILAPRPGVPVLEVAVQFDAGRVTNMLTLAEGQQESSVLSDVGVDLMRRGTVMRSADDVERQIAELGMSLNIYNWDDATNVRFASLTSRFPDALSLVADVVKSPAFATAELEKLKAKKHAEFASLKTIPQAVQDFVMMRELYGSDHPYSGFTSFQVLDDDLVRISKQDVELWHRSWIRPENATIFVTGGIEGDAVLAALEQAFGDWRVGAPLPPEKSIPAPSATASSARVVVVDRKDMDQSIIGTGQLVSELTKDEETAFRAFNETFGGTFSSRLNMNIREEKGWSYGVQAYYIQRPQHEAVLIVAPVQSDRTADTIREILSEAEGMLTSDPLTPDELTQTQRSAAGSQVGQYLTSAAVLQSMLWNNIQENPLDYDATRAQRYAELNLEDVRAVARKVLTPDRWTWVIVGDWSRIEKQVRELNLGPVEIYSID